MDEAVVRPRSRISAIWIIPLVALIAGVWILVQTYLAQGPLISIQFAKAEGIVPGETRVKMLDVNIGVVESVALAEDFKSVKVLARLQPDVDDLLTADAQFWVVRPRIGSQGISGLSTILSGAYIELTPGQGVTRTREFKGLDSIPLTPPSTPGLQLKLLADDATSILVGSPLLYNGYRVGRVEEVSLDPLNGQTRYTVFIDAPYDDLITTTTRFWNASGIKVTADVQGFDVRTDSLESLLTGGIAFAIPEGSNRGHPVDNGALFFLFDDVDEVSRNPHLFAQPYVLKFESSVRGLEAGAPVDYRGMRVGTVLNVGFDTAVMDSLWTEQGTSAVPVLIHLEPGWFSEDSQEAVENLTQSMHAAVQEGLRASLAIGNLLTGSLYVSLDFYPDTHDAAITESEGVQMLPTIASGFDQIEQKVASLLTKLQQLPLTETVGHTNRTLREAEATLHESRRTLTALSDLLDSATAADLPETLRDTLADARTALDGLSAGSPLQTELITALRQLQHTLGGAGSMIQRYEQKPNAFIFPDRRPPDPQPRGGG